MMSLRGCGCTLTQYISVRGIGKCLIKYVTENTAERPLCVEVLAENEPAMHLYKSMGFETINICSGVMPGNELFHVTVCCMQKL